MTTDNFTSDGDGRRHLYNTAIEVVQEENNETSAIDQDDNVLCWSIATLDRLLQQLIISVAEALDMGENQLSIDRSVDIDALIPSRHRADRSYFHYPQLNSSKIQLVPELSERERWLRQSPALSRILDEGNNNNNNENVNDDAAAAANDDAAVADDVYDDATANDDYQNQIKYICEDKTCTVNEQCTKFLFGFLEGTTDAKDNCEGIMNAYVAADCGTIKKSSEYSSGKSDTALYADDDDFNDDYFGIFYDHQCCSSLRSHYYEYCDSSGMLNEFNLLVVAAVMLLCECAKSVVKNNNIRWLPEAGACMLVGMAMAGLTALAGYSMEQFAFDEEIFMYILLPPIIFEAALTVNKREFRRRRGAIIVFAVFGTLISSFVTGAATYYTAKYLGQNSLTMLDSLIFGSLISSIDPVAILSVLTSLNMSETDTIYIIVLGESLLNDGIAITLFKSLVQSYQSNGSVTADAVLGSIADFLIIATGSFAIGLVCGFASLFYFLLNKSILHPVMEVASFFLWAVVPYWLAEAFDWSGIVAIVVMGFFMDMYLRPGWDAADLQQEEEERINRLMKLALAEQEKANVGIESPHANMYYNWGDGDNSIRFRGSAVDIPRPRLGTEPPYRPPSLSNGSAPEEAPHSQSLPNPPLHSGDDSVLDSVIDNDTVGGVSSANVKAIILKREFVRLSREADEHVRFVAHILSSLSENAIFAYLGLFLFSSKYKWDALLCTIGTISCILSRAVMVVLATWFIWYLHVFRQRAGCGGVNASLWVVESDETKEDDIGEAKIDEAKIDPSCTPISKSARALSNYKVQVVLILAGLRGAVSLALVESVPIYNGVTGIGSKNKSLLKAMTSSAIIFTIFVLGGGAWYILKRLDISDEEMLIKTTDKDRDEPFLPAGLYCGGRMTDQELELATAPTW
eukprot:CAMPEP_0113381122 /NCGR_PEP_ID=MMETSP0013_2-20120614/5124_1 /TAXON_ID=2843 ORGANISM="Skeletonema costatum, Strain 1716" /NCGR_SAMPLE_ID=MMETSP0013_2 /ASSEMBLY_ACC=CAM_ASM_000158 /LENGTH=913 /DNA_ID=CAMNT_0000263509 /DNA_START=139 /DNA_END=2878 /DNA_ORIENTATION=+ /assembly_acc=CAM_ASM_000158